ncbi:MAG: deoxyhypusine synthase [Methanotrichaceae archaeon]|nr:deoxyhypusine synthase [Methanotrichaceae archaeon]
MRNYFEPPGFDFSIFEKFKVGLLSSGEKMEIVKQIELSPGMSVNSLTEGMMHCGFGARRLSEAVNIFETMLSGDYRKFFAVSGAIVPAGMRNIISMLIKEEHIDVLLATGANLVHDIIESFGCHCLGPSEYDDAALRISGLSRIYDVYLRDEDFIRFEQLMQTILPDEKEILAGWEFLRLLGSKIDDDKSILRSAYNRNVPIFCPALADSMIGLQAWLHSQTKNLHVDAFADVKKIVDICYQSPRSGIVIVGGGAPKNFALQSMLVTPKSFDLAIQLTTDTPEAGGLSGATLSEAISWGKISSTARYATVYGDATITLPLLVAATISRIENKKLKN